MDSPINAWTLESDSVLQVVLRDDTRKEFSTSLTGERGALRSLPFAQGYDFSGLSPRDYAQAVLVAGERVGGYTSK